MELGWYLVCEKLGSELLRASGMFSTGFHSTLGKGWMNEYSSGIWQVTLNFFILESTYPCIHIIFLRLMPFFFHSNVKLLA